MALHTRTASVAGTCAMACDAGMYDTRSRTGSVAGVSGMTIAAIMAVKYTRTGSVAGTTTMTAGAVRGFLRRGAIAGTITSSSSAKMSVARTGSVHGLVTSAALVVVEGQGKTVREVAWEVMILWGLNYRVTPAADIQDSILNLINGALQEIHSRAVELGYIARQLVTVTVPANAEYIAIPQHIQSVDGECWLTATNAMMRPMRTLGEYRSFVAQYYGDGKVPSEPRAYFLDAAHQPAGDSLGVTLRVAPPPQSDTEVSFSAYVEPQRYTWRDVERSTPVDIPHRYAETLLLPIVCKRATYHAYYTSQENNAAINDRYAAAVSTLGWVTTQPENAKPKREEKKETGS